MPPKPHNGEEDDELKTFEKIIVFLKGDNTQVSKPVGVLLRDPRVEEKGGFTAQKGYIVDFQSNEEGDTITLLTDATTVTKITRQGPEQYNIDDGHDVYTSTIKIECNNKSRSSGRRRNHRN